MNKKSRITLLVFVALLILTATITTALAADLANGSGQACAFGSSGTWHFVNNQTGGAAAGQLTATFADAGVIGPVGPSAVNAKTQHFYISGPAGALVSASTNLPGKLVLSDFTCTEVTKTPPPKK